MNILEESLRRKAIDSILPVLEDIFREYRQSHQPTHPQPQDSGQPNAALGENSTESTMVLLPETLPDVLPDLNHFRFNLDLDPFDLIGNPDFAFEDVGLLGDSLHRPKDEGRSDASDEAERKISDSGYGSNSFLLPG
jgi:hypothetical protein